MPRGGKRVGAGRPKGKATKTVRVPLDVLDEMAKQGADWNDVLAFLKKRRPKKTKLQGMLAYSWETYGVKDTAPDRYSTAYCIPEGHRFAVKYYPSQDKFKDVWIGVETAEIWGWLKETPDGWVWDNAPGVNLGPGDPEVFTWKTEGKSIKVAFAYWLSDLLDKRIKVKDLEQK